MKRTLLSVLIGAIGMPQLGVAAPLTLVQFPAGSANRQPAPNVIITLDDSRSMGFFPGSGDDDDDTNPASGMYALKAALQEIFDANAQTIPDGAIRLAWNAMNRCRSIPSNDGGCANRNGIRVLDATSRAAFLNWVGRPAAAQGQAIDRTKLYSDGGTPTHHAFIAAGDYLMRTPDRDGPWADVPGTTLGTPKTCRRSYSVLMTDGGWSFPLTDALGTPARVSRGGGNVDGGATRTLPDGTVYDITRPETRIYRDTYGGGIDFGWLGLGSVSTLSDLAFYYWATDLAPSIDNRLVPVVNQVGSQAFTSGNTSVTLDEYWNPKNNKATWQHMTTYAIGFRDAAEWPTTGVPFNTFPVWTGDTHGGPSYAALVTGVTHWPDPDLLNTALPAGANSPREQARKVELWHSAINSRGKFISASSKNDLVQAFKDIFGAIGRDNSTPVTSFTNSSSSISSAGVRQYTSGYEAKDWVGYVKADALAQSTGAATPDAGWGVMGAVNMTTAHKLDALAADAIPNRLILTSTDASPSVGALFEWAPTAPAVGISATQKTLLRANSPAAVTDAVGQQRLEFVRGDRSREGTTFRTRGSRQGDIVNSQIWYVAQPVSNYAFDAYLAFAKKHKDRLPMVYVGGNDGMLHGFSGIDGSEKIAYVPKGVVQNLPELTRTDYQHRYFVDGSPFSGDVNLGTTSLPDWRTMLVGTLGAGGKGYFVLDVTSPGSLAGASPAVASEFLKSGVLPNATHPLVVMDKTAHPSVVVAATSDEADIGHVMVSPVLEEDNPQKTTQIVRMNDGRWAAVMGNGYNSTNERPVLLIQYLDGLKQLLKIPAAAIGTANAGANGLSAPRLVDLNGDGRPDVVYAGDLKGNLWKFDLTSTTASAWGVAFSGAPLYTATFTSGNASAAQPITAPPLVKSNDRIGGLMVAFGTGRSLTEADRTDTARQSIYSVLDNTRYKLNSSGNVLLDTDVTPVAVGTGVVNLQQQTVDTTVVAGTGNSAARSFWTVSQNSVAYVGTGAKKGWYLNLPDTGERVLDQMTFFDSSNIIELISEVPASGGSTAEESCAPTPTVQRTYRTLLNIMDGRRPSIQIMDRNGDGAYDLTADGGVTRMSASTGENRIRTKSLEIRIGSGPGPGLIKDNLGTFPILPLRPNWRQLQ